MPPRLEQLLQERWRTGSEPGRRQDPWSVALCIEGGAMRGALSGGMCAQLERQGLLRLVDRVYGTSVGALAGAYLVSGSADRHVGFFADAARHGQLFRPRPHPVHGWLDLQWLFDVGVDRMHPLDYAGVLQAQPSLHVLVTRAGWHRADDAVARYQPGPEQLRELLQAACRLPLLAGFPWGELRGVLWDAAQLEPWPMRTPLAQGATHLLVLRSSGRQDWQNRHGGGWLRESAAAALSRAGTRVTGSMGAVDYGAYDRALQHLQADGRALQIQAPRGLPLRSDERDPARVEAMIRCGRQQLQEWWSQLRAGAAPVATGSQAQQQRPGR